MNTLSKFTSTKLIAIDCQFESCFKDMKPQFRETINNDEAVSIVLAVKASKITLN